MNYQEKTPEELVAELTALRRRVADLEEQNRDHAGVERALQSCEAIYRAIFDASNDAIFIHDPATGEILDVNAQMCSMYECTYQEALHLDTGAFSQGLSPYTMEDARQWMQGVAQGEPQLFERPARTRDGRVFWVEVHLRRLSVGGTARVVALVRDVTGRKRAEEELARGREELEARVAARTTELVRVNEDLTREISERKRIESWLRDSERRYRTLVDEIPDVIFILDEQYRFVYANTQIEVLLGWPVRDMLETPLKRYVVPEDHAKLETLIQLRADGIWDEEVGLIDARGVQKFSRIRCKAARMEENGTFRFEGVMRDITRRRHLEEELKGSRQALLEKIRIIDDLYTHIVESQKARAIADHTAEVAHELRQPLAIVGGFVRRMLRQLESGEEDEAKAKMDRMVTFRIIISEIQRLERILGNLLDFTRRQDLALNRIDPNEIIETVLSVYAGMIRKKNLRLRKNLGREVTEISADPLRLEQVIRNLISNAVEASPQGETITIESGVSIPSRQALATGGLKSETYFELKIRNLGPPIPEEDLHKLFSPFHTTKSYGTGIGLSLCKKIVEDHGGSISVQSDEAGTVFTVWLPIT